jgi:hypothetical protein
MTTATKLSLYGVLLGAMVAGGAAVGAAIGPEGDDEPGGRVTTTVTVSEHDHDQ